MRFFGSKGARDGFAYAPARAGDECRLLFESHAVSS
jgi:hypothetical protein